MFAFKKGEEAERKRHAAYIGKLQQKLAALKKAMADASAAAQ